jgi:preprotein translocase subunit SecA
MDYLQEGIGLRGYGQRDPVVEYQREAFEMFGAMMEGIKEESVGFLFNLEVQVDEPAVPTPGVTVATGPSLDAPVTTSDESSTSDDSAQEPPPDLGVAGTPVPSPAPAAFTDTVEDQQPAVPTPPASDEAPQDDRTRVADVLGQVLGTPNRPAGLQYSAPSVDGEGGVTRSSGPSGANGAGGSGAGQPGYTNVSRNAPCPCGSGRKFKRCHGAPANR